MRCERCKKQTSDYQVFDYCLQCSKNLCPTCMERGCCEKTPAESGMNIDHGEPSNAAIIRKHAPPQAAFAKVELTMEDLDLIYHELAIRNCWYEKVPCTSEDLPEGLRHVAEGECNLPLCKLRRKLEEAKRGPSNV